MQERYKFNGMNLLDIFLCGAWLCAHLWISSDRRNKSANSYDFICTNLRILKRDGEVVFYNTYVFSM